MQSTKFFSQAAIAEEEGLSSAIITLLKKDGIGARRTSRMIVFEDGSTVGTLGGGDAEREAVKDAIELIKIGKSEIRSYSNHNSGTLTFMIDVLSRKKSVYIFGSGHVSRALKEVFSILGFSVNVVDAFFSEGDDDFNSDDVDSSTAIIFTDHKNREKFYSAAVDSDAFYIGLLGSRSKRHDIKDKRIFYPAGLDILSETPEECAVSIASEVLAVLNKKSALSIKDERRRFIIVKGAGDLATAVIVRLAKAGYNVLALETEKPSVIRRTVSLAEAVYDGEAEVEGVKARLIKDTSSVFEAFDDGCVPILVDEKAESVKALQPEVLIDAIIAKRNLGTSIDDAPLTIALGPGFSAKVDCDYVIETKRGHNLAKIIEEGRAEENTGIPGDILGYSKERVIHSPSSGVIKNIKKIGDIVQQGDVIANVKDVEVKASISGMLRGLIKDGYKVEKGLKIADIDPRGDKAEYLSISDKARAIAGSVLEVVDAYYYNCRIAEL